MSQMLLIFGVFVGLFASYNCEGFYTVVAPKSLRPNSEYHVSVSNLNSPKPINFRLTLNGTQAAGVLPYLKEEEVTVNSGETRVVQFDLGDLKEGDYQLKAEGLSGIIFENITNLNFKAKSFSIYVQTDKAIYKPGDTVRFRVLVLDPNTKPLQLTDSLKVHITDGKSNRVKQWLDAKLFKGVFESELPLSSSPVLGKWAINVEVLGETKINPFEVDEYVLPKFEVSIESPGFTTFKDGKVKAIIRSKYTYGKPVKGEATVSAYPSFSFGYIQPFEKDVIARKVVPIDGKGSVEFDLREELKLQGEWTRDIVFEAIVEEELTGRRQNTTTKVKIYDKKYKMDLIKSSDDFKPGLPYSAWIKLSFQDGTPVQDKINPVEVTRNFYWDSANETKQSYSLDDNGMAKLVLDTTSESQTISLSAVYLNSTFYLGSISKPRSESNTFIRAKVLTETPTINKDVTVDVSATENLKYFTYQVLGRGDILSSNTIQVPDRKVHTFKFLSTFAMVPKAKLVVSYVREDGELVSDSVDIEFGNELQNFVKVTLSKPQSKPGQDIDITINTKPNSYVGLLGVDQSVLLLKSGNDLTKDKVFSELNEYNGEGSSNFNYRRKRFAPWRYTPSYDDFNNVGAVVMTNAKEPMPESSSSIPKTHYKIHRSKDGTALYTTIEKEKPVQIEVFKTNTRPPLAGPYAFSRIPKPHKNVPRVFLSHEIQNTWLFFNTYSGYEGQKTLQKKVPDTITSWIITAFSIDPITGLGLTQQPRKLNVFQPFFVSTNLPYSVKRGEVVSIPIVIFNYMETDQMAEITLHNTEQEFEFTELENEIHDNPKVELYRRKNIEVPANSGKSVSFMVKPKKIGHITIKVTATSELAGDGVERQLLVEPEGLPQFVNKANFVDLRQKPEAATNFTIEIPKNAVPDSTKIEVSVIGDVLGSTIKNLDKLIRMPYGCGEQNMLNFVPNIVVLDYLKNTNQLNPSIESKAKKYMESGYQRELTYKHADGSFSAFGESDKSGSTWLTAFVAKSFKQAANHISVDEKIIERSLEWLSDQQAQNGSFPEVGKVSHKDMQGGSGQGIALTAYTLITFLENANFIPKYKNTINKALDYIVRNSEGLEDVYAVSLAAYALQLADHSSKEFMLSQLDGKATTDSGTKWWHKPIPETEKKNPWNSKPNSVNVEMTSYAMLAFLKAGLETDALPIMKWLISQRNEKGGFESTQDTVVGLQALAQLAAKISSANNDVTVVVTYNDGVTKTLNINKDNSMILQTIELPPTLRNVDVSASGSGFSIVQLSYKYNMNVTGQWPRFVLDPQVNKNSNPDYLHLSVCTSFVPADGQNVSNMAVMEVGFPSGFTADLDTLPSLENIDYIKKVETKDGDTVVVLYFDNLDRKELCPTITAFRTHKVAKQKPAPVVIYDYYDNTRIARQFYQGPRSTLCDICDGVDCGNSCAVKSQKQRSPKDVDPFRSENNSTFQINGSVNHLSSPFLLISLISLLCLRFL